MRRTLAASTLVLLSFTGAACGSANKNAKAAPLGSITTVASPDAGLPTVTGDAKSKPIIAIPKSAAPTKLAIKVITPGTGAAVEAKQKISVHYVGQIWNTGAQFDASWDRGTAPTTFSIGIGQVIDGWDEGLVGQKIGSRILLVVPPDKGYGSAGRAPKILGTDTMVFVVDIVDSK